MADSVQKLKEDKYINLLIEHSEDEENLYAKALCRTLNVIPFVSDHFRISKAEARRVLKQGGIRADGEVVTEEEIKFTPGMVLQKGKRGFVRLQNA